MNVWWIFGENVVNCYVEYYGNVVICCESLVYVEMFL